MTRPGAAKGAPRWAPIELWSEVGSTNDRALEAARLGAPHGTMIVADRQTAGRGRRELGGQRRAWHSPPGQNLYASLIARPALSAASVAPITLAAAVALARAIGELDGLWIKWPNDLWVGERKLAGVLTEGVLGVRGALEAVVIGVGVNVNATELPPELGATSLALERGRTHDRLSLARALRSELIACVASLEASGLAGLMSELSALDQSAGRAVEWDQGAVGRAVGIAPDGGLDIEREGAGRARVYAGEVRFLPRKETSR